MALATIENRANTVRVNFNDVGQYFNNMEHKTIAKVGTGIDYRADNFDILTSTGNDVNIKDGQQVYFINPDTGVAFVTLLEIYEYLDGLIL